MINIYKLLCPITNEIKYVGKTAKSLDKRLAHHFYTRLPKNGSSLKQQWLFKLWEEFQLKPIIELIEQVEDTEGLIREKYWIEYYISQDINLVNSSGKDYFRVHNRQIVLCHKKLYAYDKDYNLVIYEQGIREASNILGIPYHVIHKSSKGSYHMNGIVFSLTELSRDTVDKRIKGIKNFGAIIGTSIKDGSVVMFNSQAHAALELGCKRSNISRALSGSRPTAKGYVWRIKQDDLYNKQN